LVAIIRLAVPYTGMILSTRESVEMREDLLQLGVSQLSAGSRTNIGQYSKDEAEALGLAEEEDDGDLEQFELQVNRGGYERPLGPQRPLGVGMNR
jgi:2-iminoacetate synthase